MAGKKNITLFFRSFFIQAYWNNEGLQNVGFVFLILPFLKKMYAGSRERLTEALERHRDYFVTNPYIVNIIAAFIIEKEAEFARGAPVNAGEIAHLKRFLSSPLAAIGDSFIWGCWRPFSSLAGSTFLFLYPLSRETVLAAVAVFLAVYNCLTFAVRYFSASLAWKYKDGLFAYIQRLPIARLHQMVCVTGLLLITVLLGHYFIFSVRTPQLRIVAFLFGVVFMGLRMLRVSPRTIFFVGLGVCVIFSGLELV